MQDNSTNDVMEMLIRYVDGELSPAEKEATEQLLQNDAVLQERYQHFLAAKKAIRAQGLKQRVQAIHSEYMQTGKPAAKVVKRRSSFTTFTSIAAVFILIIAAYGAFQYSSTSTQSVYNDNFISYGLPVNRSVEKKDDVDALYNAGNYAGVIQNVNDVPNKNQKDYFLLAQSHLQLNNANAAIEAFRQVEALNNKSKDKYFVQETDYYLMLAYIKENKIELAEKRLNQITSTPRHLFYNKAKDISSTELMILKWKKD